MNKKLYLASKSVQRGRLLKEAGFEVEVINQNADEKSCDWGMTLRKLTAHIARLKMESAQIPSGKLENQKCWIITADSLCIDKHGKIFGKPVDRADAIRMVKEVREGTLAGTAFCIDRRVWSGDSWKLEVQYGGYAQGDCTLDVPDDCIEWYFKMLKERTGLDYMNLAGAFSITGLGAQFFKCIDGSYTGILGLPMYEVRKGLNETGFFD